MPVFRGCQSDFATPSERPPARTAGRSNTKTSDCWLVFNWTASGWVYYKSVTAPTQGVYNCDLKNTPKLQGFT